MSMFGDLLNADTIRGIFVLFLIIFFLTGRGFQMIANLIRRGLEGR